MYIGLCVVIILVCIIHSSATDSRECSSTFLKTQKPHKTIKLPLYSILYQWTAVILLSRQLSGGWSMVRRGHGDKSFGVWDWMEVTSVADDILHCAEPG